MPVMAMNLGAIVQNHSHVRSLILAGTASAVFGLTPTVQAAPSLSPAGYANGSENFHVVVGSPSLNENVDAGGFIGAQVGLLPGPATILFWCYELDQFFGFGNTYTDYVATSVTPAAAATALSKLFTEAGGPGGATSTTDRSAAFQLAVWEIKYDTGGGPYDLASGDFQVTAGSATTIGLAQSWLDGIASTPALFNVTLLSSVSGDGRVGHQDFVTGSSVLRSVPEPSPLPLLGAGLAAMLIAARRRVGREI